MSIKWIVRSKQSRNGSPANYRIMTDNDTYYETDSEVELATPEVTAHILWAVAETLEDAPESKRYDLRVTLEEYDHD